MPQQRTLSMPQLLGERKENIQPDNVELRNIPNIKPPPVLYGPPKPPRTAAGLERAMLAASGERNDRNFDKAEIRTALQNWQLGLMMNDQEASKNTAYITQRGGRGLGDGKPSGKSFN